MLRLLTFLCFLLVAPNLAAQTNGNTQTNGATTGDAPGEEVVITAGSQTEEQVRAALKRIDELSSIEAEFADGVVTLSGTVPSSTDRETAENLAGKVPSVLWVDNNIRVAENGQPVDDPTAKDEQIREKLERIFANVEELSEVDVTVQSGVVRLDGTVLSNAAADRAEELAKSQDGVVYVENSIEGERDVAERVSPAIERAKEIIGEATATLPLFGVGLVLLLLFWLFARLVTTVDFPYRRLKDKPLIEGIVKQAIRLVVITAGILLVLELFDLTGLVGAVLGTAGVAGIAVGFAFKDIGENYLAGLMLSIRQPFEKNDVVEVGDLEGKVVRLTTRETVLMTLDGNHLRIPNSVVFGSIITNYTRNPLRRFQIAVGVGVGEDLTTCLKVGRETLEQTHGVLSDPKPYGLVKSLGDFTVNIRFFAWIDQTESDYYRTHSEAVRRVKVAFDHAGIDMPEPTQRVLQASFTPPPPKEVPPLAEEREAIEPEDEEHPSEQVDQQIEKDRESSDEGDLLQ